MDNNSSSTKYVNIMFTFLNGTGFFFFFLKFVSFNSICLNFIEKKINKE